MSQVEKYILIGKYKLENIFLKAKENEPTIVPKLLGFGIGIFITLLTTTIIQHSQLSKEAEFPTYIIVFYTIIAFLFLLILVLFFSKKRENIAYLKGSNTFEKIKENIEQSSEYKEENTIIILDPKKQKNKNGKIEYLFPVKKHITKSNSYYFPFIKDAKKYKDNKGQLIIEDIKRYINEHYEIEIPLGVIYISELDVQDIALKDRLPVEYYFQFIYIYSESSFFKGYLHTKFTAKNREYEYKSIDELLDNKDTLLNNTIVVNQINNKIQEVTKNVKMQANKKTHIIWNIDEQCSFECSFCAYGIKKSKSMTIDQKKKVIDAMNAIDIDDIDFAVGATTDISDFKRILEYAKNKLQNTTIRITATANVIKDIETAFFKNNKIGVDITYNYPHSEIETSSHRPIDYNENNYKIAETLIKDNIRVHAHVVIHNSIVTNIEYLQEITDKLNKIGIKEILFIRLMPVGRQKHIDYPNELKERSTYDGALNIVNAGSSKNIELHCALRGLNGKDYPCQLGCRKLGISQNGDIFTCPWAEHLNIDNNINPFYIGNIINKNFNFMKVLLESENFMNTLNQSTENQPHCKIFSYLENNSDIFSKKDPLYH